MSHRAHLFSLRIGHALRESLKELPFRTVIGKDLMAGVTVGIIAIPLAMALGIASGVAPQYGLYTAIIAGFIIALCGGSRLSISGPTAAFVVILYPVAIKFGLAGLLVATVLSGFMLIGMAILRLGRLIEYIPESVTLGFTGGIAVVIATLQVKDFLGLSLPGTPEHFIDKVILLFQYGHTVQWPSLVVALLTFATMLVWPRLKTPVPPHLPAVVLGGLLAALLNLLECPVDTVGSRFNYVLPSGETGLGIPPVLPEFQLPWLQPGPAGGALTWDLATIQALVLAAFAMAMLGAIESLLCAVVLDGMTGKRHSANSELLGQGIGNLVAPFFGGITATAAIARSAANYRSGAQTPMAAMIHALVVLLGLVVLAPALAYLPMSSMAALLIVVAWNMSEAPKSVHLLKKSPRSDILVFFTCFSLTVLFDMVIAITTGILLAALLFMKEIAEMTKVTDVTQNKKLISPPLPESWGVFKISGPLFFAAADRVFGELGTLCDKYRVVILYMDGVTLLDAGGLAAMERLIAKCQKNRIELRFADFQFQPLKALAKSGMKPIPGTLAFYSTLAEAIDLGNASELEKTS